MNPNCSMCGAESAFNLHPASIWIWVCNQCFARAKAEVEAEQDPEVRRKLDPRGIFERLKETQP